jgi:hypothetical protein
MNCNRVRDLLPDYSMDMLDGRERQDVQSHLTGCEDCRTELRAQDAVIALIEEHGARQPPPGLFNGVRNAIESGVVVREKAPWWAWIYTGPARAGAMSLALGALALGIFLPVGSPVSTQSLPLHIHEGPAITTTALASSIRQHAMSAAEGPLADRVAWEAMAQLVAQDDERELRQ